MYWDENVDIWGQIDLSGSEYELSQKKAWYKKNPWKFIIVFLTAISDQKLDNGLHCS